MPAGVPGGKNSYFLFSLLVPKRDEIAARLRQRGIETRVCYPMPLYRQPIFRSEQHPYCPVAEEAAARILNPPMFFGLTEAQQRRIASELRAALEDFAPGDLRKAV
jgi:dTDP-4-amino-4,6-dideoxygalactose transaminase